MKPPARISVISSNRLSCSFIFRCAGIGLIFFLFNIGIPHASESVDLPTNVCNGDFCGPSQQDIWNRFQIADGLKPDLIPRVYSGICYHNSRSLDPHVPQFGGILIDKNEEMLFFHGKFSFHIKTNPYEKLDVPSARGAFPINFRLALYDRFAYAEATDSFAPFRYWFRQEKETDGLLLVGFFGFEHTILCRLE